MSDKILIGLFIFALIGFADTSYISAKQYIAGETVPCSIVSGCEQVLTSAYSKIAGIPLAFFGLAFYLTILILTAFYWEFRFDIARKLISAMTAIGFIFSLFLLFVQGFVLNAYCTYCLISFFTSSVLFGLAHHHRFLRKRS